MISLDHAAKIFNVNTNELKKFCVIDSFNPNITLNGFICTRANYNYGSLLITKINDTECEQLIWATPKLEYPFDINGVFHWPDVKDCVFYEKLDGTNILGFKFYYKDKEFITFKTRLSPVLNDSGFASFLSMWKEVLSKNDWIYKIINDNPLYNFSFELYGSRNPITIKYDVELDTKLLFAIRRNDHAIKPITEFNIKNCKVPYMYKNNNELSLTDMYNKFRESASSVNEKELKTEGFVMYAYIGEPSWKMLKCKPEEIERIHWTASGHIPKHSLFTTAINVFESYDNPIIDNFIELLKEEYPENLITKNTQRIQNIWKLAMDRMNFIKNVNEVYKKAIYEGFDINNDKNKTMRFMSKFFGKNIMKRVGSVILKNLK